MWFVSIFLRTPNTLSLIVVVLLLLNCSCPVSSVLPAAQHDWIVKIADFLKSNIWVGLIRNDEVLICRLVACLSSYCITKALSYYKPNVWNILVCVFWCSMKIVKDWWERLISWGISVEIVIVSGGEITHAWSLFFWTFEMNLRSLKQSKVFEMILWCDIRCKTDGKYTTWLSEPPRKLPSIYKSAIVFLDLVILVFFPYVFSC